MNPAAARARTIRRALSAALCTATAGTAMAQASRDLANRPPALADRDGLQPIQVTLYGLLNIGWRQPDNNAAPGATGPGDTERSHIGLRATEVLGRNLHAHMQLEQTLHVGSGALKTADAPFEARATVGLSERDLGRIDLGRMAQAAASLVVRADPWSGADTVGPGTRLHALGTGADTRASAMLSYSSPLQHPVRAVLQVSRPRAETGALPGHGLSLAWDRLPWLVGLAMQRHSDGERDAPLVIAHDDGRHRIALAWTEGRGRTDAAPGLVGYRNLFIGLTLRTMEKGDPQRNAWRAGLNLHRVDGGLGSDTKLGVGWQHRLSRRIWTNLGAAWIHPQQGQNRWGLEATLTYSFERDLRKPQGPR